MDKYKDLLVDIFGNSVRDSTRTSREDWSDGCFKYTDISIKFTTVQDEEGVVYEKVRELLKMVIEDVKNDRRSNVITSEGGAV